MSLNDLSSYSLDHFSINKFLSRNNSFLISHQPVLHSLNIFVNSPFKLDKISAKNMLGLVKVYVWGVCVLLKILHLSLLIQYSCPLSQCKLYIPDYFTNALQTSSFKYSESIENFLRSTKYF